MRSSSIFFADRRRRRRQSNQSIIFFSPPLPLPLAHLDLRLRQRAAPEQPLDLRVELRARRRVGQRWRGRHFFECSMVVVSLLALPASSSLCSTPRSVFVARPAFRGVLEVAAAAAAKSRGNSTSPRESPTLEKVASASMGELAAPFSSLSAFSLSREHTLARSRMRSSVCEREQETSINKRGCKAERQTKKERKERVRAAPSLSERDGERRAHSLASFLPSGEKK